MDRGPDGQLQQVAKRFARWRRNRVRGARIPAPLWEKAVSLGRSLGVSRVAIALGLDYYSLQRRVVPSSELSSLCGERKKRPPSGSAL